MSADQSKALQFILQNKALVQQHMRRHEQTWVEQETPQPNEAVRVYIRGRPLLERDITIGCYSLLAVQPPSVLHFTHPTVRCAGGRFATKTYQADGVFCDDATSEEVYRAMNLSASVEKCVREPGSKFSLIAYGQTGSGKTYSTTAIEEYIVEDLFTTEEIRNASSTISLSIFELQGNSCRDLLSNPALAPVTITTTSSQELSYGNLSTLSVKSKDEMLDAIRTAKGLRITRSTLKNDTSSRSHCIVMIDIRNVETNRHSRLQIVDLAGSERFKDVTRNNAERVKESIEVNKSLSALKDCVRSRLSDKTTFTPWRSTKLTTVLRESLDRRSKGTVIILACISPSPVDVEDTSNTLKWVIPFQLAVQGGMETAGSASMFSFKDLDEWDRAESIAYIQRNFPKIAPFVSRLLPTEESTILDLCHSSLPELKQALEQADPSEVIAPDARALNQAKASLPGVYQRLQLLEQRAKEFKESGTKGALSPAAPSGGMKRNAQAARRILAGKDSTAAETGLVTRFSMRGELIEEQIVSDPSTIV